jgi:putative hemolysin
VIVLAAAIVVLLILVNALYVAAEFATVSSRRARVAELAAGDEPAARALLPVLEDRALLDRYIAASQVGITLSSLLIGFYGQAALTPRVAPLLANLGLPEAAARSVTVTGVLLVLTFLQVIFGELLPKSVALRFPERLALGVVYPMRWSLLLLRPLIAVLNGSALLILRRFGKTDLEQEHVHHPDELEGIFSESAEGGLLDADERDMLSNVFHLRQRVARQIMVPRTRIVGVSVGRRPDEAVRELIRAPHTRFPVYDGSIDRLRGFVDIRDLWALAREEPGAEISAIVRPLPVVPEFLPVTDVWARLRRERTGMAAVVDEFGGIAGMVTVEDILEELFGELQDEFDREIELFRSEAGGEATVRGDLLVSEVNERFLLALPEERADTIGGLVMDRLERVPRPGDEVLVAGVRLCVVEVSGQAVARLRLSAPGQRNGEGEPDE